MCLTSGLRLGWMAAVGMALALSLLIIFFLIILRLSPGILLARRPGWSARLA